MQNIKNFFGVRKELDKDKFIPIDPRIDMIEQTNTYLLFVLPPVVNNWDSSFVIKNDRFGFRVVEHPFGMSALILKLKRFLESRQIYADIEFTPENTLLKIYSANAEEISELVDEVIIEMREGSKNRKVLAIIILTIFLLYIILSFYQIL